MSTLKTNNIEHLDATSPSIVVNADGGIQVGGALTAPGALTATTGTFSGNVSIAGVLSYEDVTNIDSVGVVTARNGIRIPSGSLGIGTETPAGTFQLGDTNSSNVIIAVNTGIDINDGAINLYQATSNGNATPFIISSDVGGTETEKLRVTAAGDIGIGTATPYSTSGYKSLTLDDTTGSQIRMRTAGADRGLIYNTDTELNIYTHNNIPINFTTGSRTQATIDYEGQLTLNSQTATSFALWRKMSPVILAQYGDYARPVIGLSYQRTSGNLNASGFFGDVIVFRGSTGAGHIPGFMRVCVSSAYTTNMRTGLGLGTGAFRFVTFDYDGNSYQGIQYNTDASANILLDGWYATRGFKPFSLAASSVTSIAAANATQDGRLSSTSSSAL